MPAHASGAAKDGKDGRKTISANEERLSRSLGCFVEVGQAPSCAQSDTNPHIPQSLSGRGKEEKVPGHVKTYIRAIGEDT